ncbi:MAG TPA: 50S ribosomal protein L29 [Vicinamibacteria bacterium]|jgi:large subunit ribosomal protein L29
MKSEKFRDLSDEELEAKENDLHEQVFRLRIQKATGQLDQVGKVRATRKDLARVKTVRAERKKAASKAEAGRSA